MSCVPCSSTRPPLSKAINGGEWHGCVLVVLCFWASSMCSYSHLCVWCSAHWGAELLQRFLEDDPSPEGKANLRKL